MPINPLYRGALLIILSEFFLVLSGMLIKQLSGELPTEVIVLARNLFALLLILPWLYSVGLHRIYTQNLHLHFARAAVGVTAMTCLYYAWGNLPLAEAALIKQTAPFFVPLIALFWLGERIGNRVKTAIFIGFCGVFLILNPTDQTINIAVLIALFGAILGALAKVIVRRMSISESPQQVVFYFAFFSTVLAFVPAMLNWVTPSLAACGWLLCVAITSTIAQLLLSKGYGLAPAGQLGPYTYSSVVFAALLGWLFWQEVLDLNSIIGVVLIISAGILSAVSRKNKQSKADN